VNPRRPLLALALLLLAALRVSADDAAPLRLTLLHTNDLHGQLDPLPASPARAVLKDRAAGGFAHLASMVRAVRREVAEHGGSLLLCDAGDVFSGSPIGNETRGEAVVDAMNALGYDAVAVGNHEFDCGLDNLLRLAARAKAPWLAANLSGGGRDLAPIRPYVVLTPPRTPCRVLVIGLITPTTPAITGPGATGSARFSDPAAVARRVIAEVDADLVIVLSHLGRDDDRALAKEVDGIDVILGGHSHTPVNETVNGVAILQTHSRGISLGRLDLALDPDDFAVLEAKGRLLEVDPSATEPDPAVAAAIAPHAEKLSRTLEEVVGTLAAPLHRRRGLESSPVGNWMADVIRRAGDDAQVGITNKGGIRCDLEAGPVTYEDVYRLMPFDNVVVTMDLRGRRLRALIERHCAPDHAPGLEWSGLRVVVEPRKGGAFPVAIEVGGKPLEDDAEYRVATNSFLAAGGDGFVEFRDGTDPVVGRRWLRDLLADDLRAHSPLTPPPEARLALAGSGAPGGRPGR